MKITMQLKNQIWIKMYTVNNLFKKIDVHKNKRLGKSSKHKSSKESENIYFNRISLNFALLIVRENHF